MAKRLDQVVVIDVESTCWEASQRVGQTSEIIEVGVCTVDLATLERRDRRSILVRPQRSEVSPFCTRLTSLTAEMVAGGVTLDKAVHVLKHDYNSQDRLFASWGDYDRNQFLRNCRDYGLDYPFGPTHLNVKNLFSLAFSLPKELGIDDAFQCVGLTMEGTHHRGVDDAWNIAQLLCFLLRRLRKGP